MARFSIISKDGNKIRYEGKPRYIGTYLKPSYLEFSEIASPTPIDWEVGDYIDYPRTGMRYRLYSIPQASKNARKGSHGRAFTYSNVQLHAATKELEIALFKDLVSADNDIHFSTSPDVATFEDVYGIARRIQACMDDLYPNRWVIEVADFNAVEDAEMLENITTAKDFALSGGTCLDALTKIYELWQEVGWIHTYDSASGKDVITIGYANKRIGANTTEAYIYGKGNGLTAIKKTQANKDEFATRLYVYGSDRNLPSRYYNGKYILNAESLDIRNLMIPIGQWKTTGGVPDARKAYLENAEAVAKYGVIPKTHYFDSDDAGADIYPTIEGVTIGQVRRLQADYKPSTSIYPNDEERIDEVRSAVNPTDDGVIRPLGKAYKYYKIENVEAEKSDITLTDSTVVKVNKILLLTDLEGEGKVDMTVIPNIGFALDDAGFTEVNATFELTDSPTKTKNISKISSVVAKRNGITGRWEFKAPRISVDYDYVSTGSIPVSYVLTLEATLSEKREGEKIAFDIEQGEIEVGANALLDKEFTITLKQIGFNIEERASVGSGKTISMKTGDNEGRNFVIKECRYEGSSDSWILTCKRQQDNNLGMLFPNKDYQIKQNDRFVLLDIAMPELYVAAAMERLFTEGQKLLSKVSRIQNNYEPSIDAKVMAESGRTIREGMFMQIADEDIIDGATEYILIDTINIYEDEAVIPTYKVTLKEKKKVSYKGTPSATTTSNTSSVEEKTDVDLSGYVTKEKFAAIEFLKDLFYKYDDTTYGTKYNLFSEKEMSANGLNLGGGTSGGGGLIQNVLGKSAFGTVASEDNATTFNAYAIDSLYKRIVELEGKDVEVDLSDYYTKQQTQNAITSALSPYIKATDADGKYAALASFNALQSSFDRLYSALNDDTSGVINTWNEVVDFVNEYSGSEDLSTILGKMNTDINARVKVSDFDTWKTDVFNPLSVTVTNLGKKVDTNTANINKLLGWFNVDADGNLFTTLNFYSTKEISANGISQGTGGGGSGLISSVLGVGSLGATLTNDNSVVFNAYATNEIYKATQGHASRIGVLESQVGQLTTQRTKVSVSDLLTTGTKIATITVDGVPHEVKGDFLPTNGGEIKGDARVVGYLTTDKNRIRLGSHYMLVSNDEWMVTDANWQNQYSLLHSGNIGEYAFVPRTDDLISNVNADNYVTNGAYLNQTGNGSGSSNFPMPYSMFLTFSNGSPYRVAQLSLGGNKIHYRIKIDSWTNWKEIACTVSNVASATKLETPRKLWGNDFDGTGNVSGNITGSNFLLMDRATNPYLQLTDSLGTVYFQIVNGNAYMGSISTKSLMVDGSGNVGIGTTNPQYKLDVNGDAAFASDVYIASGKSLLLAKDAEGIYVGDDGIFWHDAANIWTKTLMVFNENGNVLIGATTDRGHRLTIGRPDGAANLTSTTLNNSMLFVGMSNSIDSYGINFWTEGSGNGFIQQGRTDEEQPSLYNLILQPFGGNVGVGTSNPAYKLDVNGAINITDNYKIGGYDVLRVRTDHLAVGEETTAYQNLATHIYGTKVVLRYGTNKDIGFVINSSGNVTVGSSDLAGTNAKLYVAGCITTQDGVVINAADAYNFYWAKGFLFSSNSALNAGLWGYGYKSLEYLYLGFGNYRAAVGIRINENGNVLIGTSTDSGYKLNVNGTLRATDAVAFGSTLTIAGATTHNGIAYFGGTTYYINTSGNTNFNAISGSSLQVDSAAFNGTIHSNEYSGNVAKWSITNDGAASFASLSNGGLLETSTLRVSSTSTFTGKTNHNGGIGATSLNVSGTSTLSGHVGIGVSPHSTYALYVDGSLSCGPIDGGTASLGALYSNTHVPNSSETYDLGSNSYRWASIYGVGADFSGNVTVNGTLYANGTLYTNDIDGSNIYITASGNLYLTTASGYFGAQNQRWAIDGYGNYKGQSLYINPRDNDNKIITDDNKKKTHGFPREGVAVFVNGDIAATGEISANALNQGSDIRFKHQLGDITLDLDTIANAPMFRFTWTNKENSRVQIGTSAQYWKDSARELVSVDKDDFHRLDYATLGVLIGVTLGKTVKNHEDRIKELEREVVELKEENRRLRYEC